MRAFFDEHGVMIVLHLLLIMAIVSVKKEKLTVPAAMVAIMVGIVVFAGAGYMGFLLLGLFFILGVWATSHKKEQKAGFHPDATHPQARNAGQVLANGGVAALCATGMLVDPVHSMLYNVMLAASLASAAADTLSSELGMVYGRNTFNILTFQKEPAGLDGVISKEGTLIGAAGSLLVAVIWSLEAGFGKGTFFVALAGFMGNLFDSLLGALPERKKYIGNDLVNFLNTLFAALVAWLLYQL